MIKFLPSYVGSKAYWVDFLKPYKGSDIVELFSGSAVLSANLAKTAVLNDLDPYIYKIFNNYKDLIVPKKFDQEDYYNHRKEKDWWKYVYCLQKMSFSGVFRYSKNGYNVPVKKDYVKEVSLQDDFEISKNRFLELNPIILNEHYKDVSQEYLNDKVVILDPPYEKKQSSYNEVKKGGIDYREYWEFVKNLKSIAKTVIVFDTKSNIEENLGEDIMGTRNMRVNGKHKGSQEAICILGENKCQR